MLSSTHMYYFMWIGKEFCDCKADKLRDLEKGVTKKYFERIDR